MRIICLIFVICSYTAVPQSETGFWSKTEVNYEHQSDIRKRDYSFSNTDLPDVLVEGLTKSYWFFISDLDGDNCPFRPSCSEFFSESVSKTNIFIGTLLFFDRFTRDLNFINRHTHYESTPDGHYSDPPEKYIF